MADKRFNTIAEYIAAAPEAAQPHLHQLYELLKSVAPDAEEAIKWNTPFFIEPRFLFGFSSHKYHLSFAPVKSAFTEFEEELKEYNTTQGTFKVAYKDSFPEEIIRKMAEYSLRVVSEREDDSFW